jgi:hypothetical protein
MTSPSSTTSAATIGLVSHGGIHLAGHRVVVSLDDSVPFDPSQDVEVPRYSPLWQHLLGVTWAGGVAYLTSFGRRVAAVVPADVAESMLRVEEDLDDHRIALRELLADSEARLGPIPPEVQTEVDRRWAAADH